MDVTRFKFLTQNLTTIFINGNLTLASDAIAGTDLATKHNVDIGFNDRALKAGDNLVGEILQTVDGYRPYDSVRKTQADALANSSSSITENQIDQLSVNKALRASPAFTGPLELDYNSYTQTSLVSKNFIDNLNKDISGVPGSITPGTVIELPTTITPSGYLRLNGASLPKATYPALYSAVGDNYAPNISGYGNPHYQQYDINNAINSTNLGSILMDKNSPSDSQENNPLPVVLANHHIFTNRNYVYSVGGDTTISDTSVIVNTVYRAQIDSTGKLSPWSTYGTYPINIAGGSCVYTKDYVYILGGANYYASNSYVTGVTSCYRASLNSNGSIGNWSAVSSLPVAIGYTSACVVGNYIYLFGGRTDLTSSASRTQIYRTVINSDGSLGAWTLYGNLPVGFDSGRVAVIGNRVYVMGGRSTLNYNTSPFLYANINSDYSLGSWTSLGNFVRAMTHFAIAVTNQKLYVFGTVNETYAYSTSYWANKVYVANITSDPNLTFTEGSTIAIYPYSTSVWLNFESLVTNSKVYLIGGKLANTSGSYTNVSKVQYFNFNGGSNDYITLLQNTSVADPINFYLPDYTYKETQNPNMKYYIKT